MPTDLPSDVSSLSGILFLVHDYLLEKLFTGTMGEMVKDCMDRQFGVQEEIEAVIVGMMAVLSWVLDEAEKRSTLTKKRVRMIDGQLLQLLRDWRSNFGSIPSELGRFFGAARLIAQDLSLTVATFRIGRAVTGAQPLLPMKSRRQLAAMIAAMIFMWKQVEGFATQIEHIAPQVNPAGFVSAFPLSCASKMSMGGILTDNFNLV